MSWLGWKWSDWLVFNLIFGKVVCFFTHPKKVAKGDDNPFGRTKGSFWLFGVFVAASLLPQWANAQQSPCVNAGLPAQPSRLAPISNPTNICAPANLELTYSIMYSNPPLPNFNFQVVFEWGDGIVDRVDIAGADLATGTGIQVTEDHDYPSSTDPGTRCSYTPRVALRVNGQECGETQAFGRTPFANWTKDDEGGGRVQLSGANAGPSDNITISICQGEDININLEDRTVLSCQLGVGTNTQDRWHQVVYNTGTANKIPGVSVGNTLVTDVNGRDLRANFEGPLTHVEPPPAVTTGSSRADIERITAPGGFGPNSPQPGDEFEVTLRYWNVCNPYDPTATAAANAANAVEAVATIEIIASPDPPTLEDTVFCTGNTLNTYLVRATTMPGIRPFFSWLRNDGSQVQSGGSTFNPLIYDNTLLNASLAGNGAGGTVDVWATVSGGTFGNLGTCVSDTAKVTFTVLPQLNGQSISLGGSNTGSTTLCSGSDPPSFTAPAATGGNGTYAYQWQRSTNGFTYSDIAGATGETFDEGPLTTTTWYRRRVMSSNLDLDGGNNSCKEAYSTTFRIDVQRLVTPGRVGTQQTICFGGTPAGRLTSLANPTNGSGSYTYQWESTTDDPATNPNPTINVEANSDNLTFVPPATLAQTTWYRRAVQSGVCSTGANEWVATDWVQITVNSTITPGSIQIVGGGTTAAICAGDAAPGLEEVSAPTGGTTYTYQWQRSANPGGPYSPIPLANDQAGYTPQQLGGTTYFVRSVTSGVCATNSNEIEIVVNPLPTGEIFGGGAICGVGSPAPDVIVLAREGTAPWTVVYSDGTTNNTVTVGAAGNTQGVHVISSPTVGTYTLVSIEDDSSCSAVDMRGTATVINSTSNVPTIVSIAPTPPVCHAGPTTDPPDAIITFNPARVANYRITYSIGGTTPPAFSRTSSALGEVSVDPGYFFWFSQPGTRLLDITEVVDITTGCQVPLPAAAQVSLRVDSVPVIVPQQSKTICSGEPADYKILMTDAPENTTRFEWTRRGISQDKLATDVLHITDTLFNRMNSAPISEVYSVTPRTPSCAGQPQDVTITINPEPVIEPGQRREICGGSVVNYVIRMTNSPLNTRLTWQHPITGAVTTALLQNTPTIIDVLPNNTPTKVDTTFYYSVTAESGVGCVSAEDSIEVVVNPVPELSSANVGKSVCPGMSVDYSIALDPPGAPANTDFSWFDPTSGNPVNVPAGAVGTIHIADVYSTSGIRNYNVVATSDRGCASATQTIAIDVNALPTSNNITRFVCETLVPGQTTGLGGGTIDLTTLEGGLGVGATDRVLWYVDYDSNTGSLTTQIPDGSQVGNTRNYVINQDVSVYAEVARSGGAQCASVAQVNLIYQPIPVTGDISYTGSGTRSPTGGVNICMDSTQSHIFQITPSTTTSVHPIQEKYSWRYPTPNSRLLPGSDDTGHTITLQFPQQPNTSVDTVSVTESHNGCAGAPKIIVINTESTAGKSIITGSDTVCAGRLNEEYEVINAPPSALYTWSLPTGVSFVPNTVQTGRTVQLNFPPQLATPTSNVEIEVTVATGSAQCVAEPADPFPVTIVGKPAMTSPADFTICSGDTISTKVALTSQGGPMGVTYDWEVTNITGGVSNVAVGDEGSGTTELGGATTELVNRSGSAGSVVYRVTPVGPSQANGGNSCRGNGQSITVFVNPEPVIMAGQLKTVCSGVQADYEILLSPVNLPASTLFTWLAPLAPPPIVILPGSNVPAGVAGTPHIRDEIENTGMTAASYTYKVTPNDGNINPKCTGSTEDVVLRVNPEPVGTDASVAVCSNVPLAYDLQDNVNSSSTPGPGRPSTFSWYATDNPNVTGETLSGLPGTGSIINDNLINHTNAPQNVIYTVVPTNKLSQSSPACAGDAFTITVTVRPEPVGMGDNVAVCSGVALGYDLGDNIDNAGGGLRSGSGITYTWTTSANPDLTGAAAGGGTTQINDEITNTTLTDQPITYTITPTHTDASGNSCTGTDFDLQVAVSPEPRGAAFSSTICSRTSPNINLQSIINTSGNRLNATFSWAGRPNANVSGISPSSTNSIIADVLVNTTGTQEDVIYEITPSASSTGGLVCEGDLFEVTVTVNPEPVGVVVPDTTVCSGEDPQYDVQRRNLAAGNGGNDVPSTFTWSAFPNTSVAGEQTTPQSTDIISGNLENTTDNSSRVIYEVTPTSRLGSCVGSSFQVGIIVDPEPVGFNTQQTICGGVALNYNLQTDNVDATSSGGNGLPSTFVWKASPNTNVSGLSTSDQNTSLIRDRIVNRGSRAQNVIYTITPTSTGGGCQGSSFEFRVTVEPQPQSRQSTKTICSGEGVNINLANNITNSLSSTYTWQATDDINVGGESSSTPKTSNDIDDVLTNTTGTSQQVVYTVTPTGAANGCEGDDFTVNVNVNPEPAGEDATHAICSNAQLAYSLQDNINDVNGVQSTFRWKSRTSVSGVSGESTVEQTSIEIRDNLTNITDADVVVTYDIFPTSTDNCPGDMFTLSLTVHPKPNANDATGLDVCSGEAFDFDLANHLTTSGNGLTANTVYDWLVPASGNVEGESTTTKRAATIDDMLSLSSAVISNQFLSYTVTPTDLTHGCKGNEFSVDVVVKPKPIGVDETVALCSDLHLNFDLVENVRRGNNFTTNTTYEWLAIDNPNVDGESFVTLQRGGTMIGDRLLNTTDVLQNVRYFYTPINSNGCKGDTVYITVELSPSPILDPALATESICSRSTGNLNPVGIRLGTVAGSIPATGYNITSSLGTIANFFGSPTQGNNLPDDAIFNDSYKNLTTSTVDVIYTVVPVSSGACLGTPTDISVTVYPAPVVNPNLDDSICSGVASGIVLSTDGTSVAAASYTLEDLTIPPLTGFTADPANIPVGTSGGSDLISQEKYVNVTSSNISPSYQVRATSAPSRDISTGCIGDPKEITLTIKPQPVFDDTPPNPTCSGVPSGIELKKTASSTSITEYNINGITRSSTSLVVGTNNASISFGQPADVLENDVFFNNTANALTVTYKIVPISAEQCVGEEGDLVLTVNPAPAIAGGLDATVCSSDAAGILLASAPGAQAALYDIAAIYVAPGLVAAPGNVTAPSVGVANTAIRNDQFENPTNDPLDVTYTVLGESANQCKGSQKNVILTVEPSIMATPVLNNVNICSASEIDIELTSPSNPTSGEITFDYMVTSASGQVTGFVGSQANLPMGYRIESALTNLSDSPTTVTYAITAVANGARGGQGCLSTASVSVDVSIEPLPKLAPNPRSQVVCEGVATAIELTTTTSPSVGGINFNVVSTTPTGGLTLSSPTPPTSAYLPGESIADVWDNPTLDYQKVTYVLRPDMDSGLGCQGREMSIEVDVRPNPQLTEIDTASVCSGLPLRIPLTMDLLGAYATWTAVAPASIVGATDGGGNRIDVTPINEALGPGMITYSVTPKIDACEGDPIAVVVRVNPSPNTLGLPANTVVCDGETLNVSLSSAVPGATAFDWTVSDSYGLGTANEFDGSGTTINQQLNNPLGYKAVLIYTVTPTSAFSCVGDPAFMNVEVISILPEITPNRTQVCSGERVQVVNTTLGALSHRWFYRRQGSSDELGITTEASVSYRLENTTFDNPIYYEVVYEASNGSCSRPGLATPPIAVYRGVTAKFDEGTIPPIRAGISEVTFTNTSNPVDDSQFRYEWNFGNDSDPTQHVGATPPTVTYFGQGFREVRLKAINNDSEAAGLACEGTFMKTIVIPVLPLVAEFTVNQPKSCIPVEVVIDNLSTGDKNEWKVLDENGVQIITSNQNSPVFVLTAAGDYTIFLTTSDSFTGQTAVTSKKLVVYKGPQANFLARPSTVFVPDHEVVVTNLTNDANTYLWDFGDGNFSMEKTPSPHKYKVEGVYNLQLIAGNDYGNGVVCRDTLVRRITARTGGEIIIPNAFTPNTAVPGSGPGLVPGSGPGGGSGDSSNDVFLPIVRGVRSFNMQIYDRWGNLLFESNSATVGWDGRDEKGELMPAGVYVYRLEIQLSDGNKTMKIGDITMLR